MSPENQEQKINLSGKKQKIMAALVIVIALVVIWEVIGLFGGGDKKDITPVAANKGMMKPGSSAGAPTATPPGTTAPSPQPELPQPKQAPVAADNEILMLQQQTQEKYLKALNELQLLKVQKDISETSQAIASAELAKVTAEKGISDVLTRPVGPPISFNNQQNNNNQPVVPGTAPLPQPVQAEVAYSVLSVSKTFGKWQAVVSYQNKQYTVTKGDVLPIDGSIVTSISNDGIVLERNSQRRVISFNSPI